MAGTRRVWRTGLPNTILTGMELVTIQPRGLLARTPTIPGRLRVVRGIAWITQTGDRRDLILHPGRILPVAGGVRVAIQPLGEGDLAIEWLAAAG